MPEKKLVVAHNSETDMLSVELHQSGEVMSSKGVPWFEPLDLRERGDLRWYLEDYLVFPVGAEQERARKIEGRLQEWGARLFNPLFGAGPGHEAYRLVRDSGLGRVGFEVRYRSARVRNVPWELLYDPEGDWFLAHQFGSFSRRQRSIAAELRPPRAGGSQLTVLVVTARPQGPRHDVPYRTVTRPIMEVLRQPELRGRVHVELLRPPTFEAFRQAIQRRRPDGASFFDLVHFDGHGGFGLDQIQDSERRLDVMDLFKGPGGKLVFETPEGVADRVEVEEVREVVGGHRVPLIVLNACRSGMEALEDPMLASLVEAVRAAGKEGRDEDFERVLTSQSEAINSISGTLLDGGAIAVVSMGYIVRAKAAAIFMRGFYDKLLSGARVGEAVSAGRIALKTDPLRPTRHGEVPLEDWLVPVYSERSDLRLFEPPTTQGSALGLLERMKLQSERSVAEVTAEQELPAKPRFGFIGRDAELLTLERALLRDNLAGVALVGLGGNGKTTLATGLMRWMVATHAPQVVGGVFFHAFLDRTSEGGIHPDLGYLVRTIGRSLFGDDQFLQLKDQEQHAVVAEHLRTQHCLLILDNVETVNGLGEQPALLDAAEREAFKGFLARVCVPEGRTRLVLTSRRTEDWLGMVFEPVRVEGLDRESAEELALGVLREALGQNDLEARRADTVWSEGYRQLLATLNGHPLALQIVLPHLARHSPAEIQQAFDQGSASFDGQLGEVSTDRESTLVGSLAFSFSTLSGATRRLLPFLAFFREWIDPDLLALASKEDGAPERIHGVEAEAWAAALGEAESTGLLTRLSDHPRSPFALHPLLPWYLTRDLEEVTDTSELEAAFRRFATGLAAAVLQAFEAGGTGAQAVVLFRNNLATLLHALELARRAGQIEEIGTLFQCLYRLLEHGGQRARAATLLTELLAELEPEGELDPESRAGALWLDLQLKRANALLAARDFDGAEAVYGELIDAAGASGVRAAAIFHQLGLVVEGRRDFESAERWYRKSLDLSLESGNRGSVASTYHQLGRVAQERRDFEDAERWYRKSLDLKLELGNQAGAASTYHQLGVVAQERRDLEGAERWYRKGLDLALELGNQEGAATTYHQLGTVAQERRDFEGAERWYRKSLDLELELGNRSGAVISYHQLGRIAETRRDFEGAERWYRKSLDLALELGDQGSVATSYQQLGAIAGLRQDLKAAENWFRKSLELKQGLGNRHSFALTQANLGVVKLQLSAGDEGAALMVGALKMLSATHDPREFARFLRAFRTVGIQTGVVDRDLVEQLWQKEFGSPIPDEVAAVLFAETDAESSSGTPGELPAPLLALIVQMRQQGLSTSSIVQAIEQGSGQRFPPEVVAWLTEQIEAATDGPEL